MLAGSNSTIIFLDHGLLVIINELTNDISFNLQFIKFFFLILLIGLSCRPGLGIFGPHTAR